jgi:hypothetical protein
VGQAVNDKVFSAVRLLFGSSGDETHPEREKLPKGRRGCLECHDLKPAPPLFHAGDATSLAIQPVLVRSLWFESAIFDHRAHRALECAACHGGASESSDPRRLLLPGIATCVECHAPSESRAGALSGGAGVACTECHRYHNGDHPAEGIGASARRGPVEMSLRRFLSGGAAPGSR